MAHTMIDVLDATADRLPDSPYCEYEGRVTTFGAFRLQSRRVAGALVAGGLQPGERVAWLGKNCDRLLELIFGAAMARGTCVVLNWRLALTEWQDILLDSGARVLVVDADFIEAAGTLAERLPQITRIVAVDAGVPADARWVDYVAWRDGAAVLPPQPVRADDDFLQLYTSGTTGRPKGVPQTHAMHLSQRAQWEARLGPLPPDDRVLVFMPCFHAAGITYPLFALAYGTQVVLHRSADPARIMAALASGRIRTTVMVPTLMAMLVQKVQPGQFPALQRIHYGASAVDPQLLARVMDVFGCDLAQIYAATETTAALSILTPDDHRAGRQRPQLWTSAGKPGGDAQLRIVGPDGQDAAPGEAGEILVRSGSILRGYWRNPQASAEALHDGWYRTGDVGRIDADGYVHVMDRLKDMIISGGENVYSSEVENALADHPDLAECAVIGLPDAHWGEVVTLCAVPRPGVTLDLTAIQDHLRARLAGFKVPRRLELLSALPRNPMGKLQKQLLRASLR
ncbi:MAG: hypothetical protein RLY78_3857 [Pseudomonadota bacterium]